MIGIHWMITCTEGGRWWSWAQARYSVVKQIEGLVYFVHFICILYLFSYPYLTQLFFTVLPGNISQHDPGPYREEGYR